ncbi:hypothetical protein CcaverHIS631_0500960 [Cutaneotrichosporon cavernicola]|nr:hypothetical protein CcaverHIS631_0500960 [Cutaneotrichosporon cavernicola]
MDIGTPSQPLELMFDTGSPALWVMEECTTPPMRQQRPLRRLLLLLLNPLKSELGNDLRCGGGLASHTDSWGHTASGLAGFGPPSSYSIPPWWVGVIDTWPEKRFGLFVGQTADWLSPIPLNTTVRGAGSVTLGGVDRSLFEGELKGTEANLTKWWSVGIDGVRINGADIDIAVGLEDTPFGTVGGRPSAMLDTGLSGLVGPIRAVEKIYAAIPGAFTVDGETSESGSERLQKRRHGHGSRHIRQPRGIASLKAWGDSYSIRAEIGTPPQQLDLYVDTGSTDLWVIGSCDDNSECGNTATFDSSASSTYTPTDQLFAMNYIDGGRTTGVWGGDVVRIGGQAVNTYFGISKHTTNWGTAQSGLLGLATRAGSSKRVEPWWEAASREWDDGQFGLYLGRPGVEGSVTFGGVDESLYDGGLTYYAHTAMEGWEAGWNIATGGVAVNGRRLSSTVRMAVLDCGSTGIVGPKAEVDAFYAALNTEVIDLKDGSYAFECSASLGINASFTFGDYGGTRLGALPEQHFYLRNADLAIVRGSGEDFAATGGYDALRGRPGTWCFGAVSSWESTTEAADAWILGDSFLKNVYSAYRVEPRGVGLAPLKSSAGGEGWEGVPSAADGVSSG